MLIILLSYAESCRGNAEANQMTDSYTAVGKSFQRIDGIDKVTGAAKYATDIRFENMLYLRILF